MIGASDQKMLVCVFLKGIYKQNILSFHLEDFLCKTLSPFNHTLPRSGSNYPCCLLPITIKQKVVTEDGN